MWIYSTTALIEEKAIRLVPWRGKKAEGANQKVGLKADACMMDGFVREVCMIGELASTYDSCLMSNHPIDIVACW